MRKILNIIKNIIIVFIAILVIINIIMLFQNYVLKSPLPNIFGYSYIEVKTGSMAPTINIGDIVIAKKTTDIKEGDIAIYKENNSLVMHRVLEVKDKTIIFKGDANNTNEEVIKENVIAKEVYTNKILTLFINIIQNRVVIILLIIIIIILMCI